jgi:hypothetical protein
VAPRVRERAHKKGSVHLSRRLRPHIARQVTPARWGYGERGQGRRPPCKRSKLPRGAKDKEHNPDRWIRGHPIAPFNDDERPRDSESHLPTVS